MNIQLNKTLFFLLAWHNNTYDMTSKPQKKTKTNVKSNKKENKEINNNIKIDSGSIFFFNDTKKSSEEIIKTLRLHLNIQEEKQLEITCRSMINQLMVNQGINENSLDSPQSKEIDDLINNQLIDLKKEQEKNLKDISSIYNNPSKMKCVYLFFLIENIISKDINVYNILKKYLQKLKPIMQERNHKMLAAFSEYLGSIEKTESIIRNIEDDDVLKKSIQHIDTRIHSICEEFILKILDYLEQQNYDSKLFYIQINNDKFDVTQIIKEIKNENDLKKQEIYEFINMIITYIVLYKELPFDTPSL
jgi:hypothetical protein